MNPSNDRSCAAHGATEIQSGEIRVGSRNAAPLAHRRPARQRGSRLQHLRVTSRWQRLRPRGGFFLIFDRASNASNAMPKPVRDTEKARRAARHPDRPGEDCRAAAGSSRPVVDRARCEGKKDCVDVCPEEVFEVRRIDDADFAALGFFGQVEEPRARAPHRLHPERRRLPLVRPLRGGVPREGHQARARVALGPTNLERGIAPTSPGVLRRTRLEDRT